MAQNAKKSQNVQISIDVNPSVDKMCKWRKIRKWRKQPIMQTMRLMAAIYMALFGEKSEVISCYFLIQDTLEYLYIHFRSQTIVVHKLF